jgi:hypothetical protein
VPLRVGCVDVGSALVNIDGSMLCLIKQQGVGGSSGTYVLAVCFSACSAAGAQGWCCERPQRCCAILRRCAYVHGSAGPSTHSSNPDCHVWMRSLHAVPMALWLDAAACIPVTMVVDVTADTTGIVAGQP